MKSRTAGITHSHRKVAALALFFALLAAGCSGTAGTPGRGAPTVRQVRLLAELERQRPIRLPLAGAGTVRLGVSDRTVRRGGGVVLYCLWEGDEWPPGPLRRVRGIRLGPLTVRDRTSPLRTAAPIRRHAKVVPRRALFAATVPVVKKGTDELGVYFGGKLVAQADITTSGPPAPSWRPFPRGAASSIDSMPHALPALRGELSIKREDLKDGRLPVLFPDAEDGLDLGVEGGSFRLSARTPLSSRLDRHLLMRVWFNGKPLLWDGIQRSVDTAGTSRAEKTARGKLNWKRLLGKELKDGDEISVQVLYSARGWVHVMRGVQEETDYPKRSYAEPLLSRKVTFRP